MNFIAIFSHSCCFFFQYSKSLSKLYIVWNKIIPIQFKWTPNEGNFVVRALPVFTDAQDMKNPVLRCILHCNREEETNDGEFFVVINNIEVCKSANS